MNNSKSGLVTIPINEFLYAVLAIGLVIVLFLVARNVSHLIFTDQNKVQAEGMLERFSFFLDNLKDGQVDKFLFYAPKGFFVIGAKGLSSLDNKPLCTKTGCVCICETEGCTGNEVYCKDLDRPFSYGLEQRPIEIEVTEMSLRKEAQRYSIVDFSDINSGNTLTSTTLVNPSIKVETPGFLPAKARPADTKVSLIVLHHTAGTSWTGAYSEFVKDPSKKSVHYILDKDGTIYYIVDENLQAEHAGDLKGFNAQSIGIEIVNTGSEQFTDAQYTSLNSLLRDITRRYNFPYDDAHIIAHYQTAQGVKDDKQDPSTFFAWAKIGLQDHPLKSQVTSPALIA